MLRVAIIDGLSGVHVARSRGVTVVCMPAVMSYCDVFEQCTALYRDEEAAVFRSYYNVSAANGGEAWADVLPSRICPCLTPSPLRLDPWPPCPLHDGPRVAMSVVEVAERMLAP